jgi:DNA-binding NtrC family response regulator
VKREWGERLVGDSVAKRKIACVFTGRFDGALRRVLLASGWDAIPFDVLGTSAKHVPALAECQIGIIVLAKPNEEWLGKLQSTVEHLRDITWIAVGDSALVNESRLRELITVHCVDYLTTPLDRQRVLFSLGHAAGMAALAQKYRGSRQPQNLSSSLIGNTPTINALRSDVRKIAAVAAPVLITGESGTGKELVAREIHEASERRENPFVEVSCVSLAPSLIHAELFGYERGAFTGAHRQKIGHLESAHRGTIFLDEIGDLHLELQAILLRFLQEQTVRRVGGRDSLPVDVRVLAATNIDLESAVKDGRFRLDLYYRLNVLRIKTPPLRERQDDISVLAHVFLERFGGEGGARVRGFSKSALTAMREHSWPGNVRELLNRVRRAIVMCEGNLVSASDLNFDAEDESEELNLEAARSAAERRIIVTALRRCGWSVGKSAQMIGVSRATFYRLLEKCGVAVDDRERAGVRSSAAI